MRKRNYKMSGPDVPHCDWSSALLLVICPTSWVKWSKLHFNNFLNTCILCTIICTGADEACQSTKGQELSKLLSVLACVLLFAELPTVCTNIYSHLVVYPWRRSTLNIKESMYRYVFYLFVKFNVKSLSKCCLCIRYLY